MVWRSRPLRRGQDHPAHASTSPAGAIARARRPRHLLTVRCGGSQRPSGRSGGDSRSGGQRAPGRGPSHGRGGAPQGPPPGRVEPLVMLSKAAEWWSINVFKGLNMQPIEPKKLLNGHTARPNTSTAGKAIHVVTNHLLLDVGIGTVGQWEVKLSKLPPAAPADGADAATSSGQQDTGNKQGGGGGRGRDRGGGVKVTGPEAHAVLSYVLDTTPSGEASKARDAWVYDGGAVLYTAFTGSLLTAAAAAAGGSGGSGDDGGQGEDGGDGAVQRQPDGSLRVEVPAAVKGPAAGSTYKLELRRTAVLDVQQCLRDAQRSRTTGRSSEGAGDAHTGPSAPEKLPDSSDSLESWGPDAGAVAAAAAPPPSPRAGVVDSEAAALAVVELVSRAAAAWDADTVRAGQGTFVSYRTPSKNPISDSGSLPLKLLDGFRSAVAVVAAGTTLTVDAASAVVAGDGPLLAQLKRLQGALLGAEGGDLARALQQRGNAARLEAALAGLEVKASHSPITYKLSGKLSAKPASQLSFKIDDGGGSSRTVTVQQYFKERYGVVLLHPELPCALTRKGAALPLELLTVLRSQKRMSRLDAKQKAEYIRAAAAKPADRLRAARAALAVPLRRLAGGVAAAFGLQAAAGEFLRVPARLLPGPLLEVTRGSAAQQPPRPGTQSGGQQQPRPAPMQPSSGALQPPQRPSPPQPTPQQQQLQRQSGGLEVGNAGEWNLPGVAVAGSWTSGAVVCYLDRSKDAAAVATLLFQLGDSLSRMGGARMPKDLPVVWASPPRQGGGGGGRDPAKEAEDWLRKAATDAETKYGAPPQLLLVVLPEGRQGDGVYGAVKAASDGALRIPTQCVNPSKASLTKGTGPTFSYTSNLALGVNAKLGGITTRPAGQPAAWAPLLGGRRLMVLGADVSRGAAAAMAGMGQQQQQESGAGRDAEEELAAAAGIEFAAVMGSVDSHGVDFRQVLSAQSGGNRDVILGMRDSVAALLRGYAEAPERGRERQPPAAAAPGSGSGSGSGSPDRLPLPASSLPEVLLMYRDGVADSMFDAVLAEEFTAIKQACADVGGPGYNPAVTFAVVQKRHNTRIFPAPDKPGEAHKSGNVLPGTAVDQDIVDAASFDFFLNSHAGIQGTNKAPRYTVLVDEVGFTSEALQLLTFTLCHTYPACNRSLSLPPAARLADRAADRARVALKGSVSRLTAPQPGAARGGGRKGSAGAPPGSWFELLPAPFAASSVV